MPNIKRGMMGAAGVSDDDPAGKLFMWAGIAGGGRSGLGNTTAYSSPVQCGTESDWTRVDVSTQKFSGGIRGGKLFTWGYNDSGQLGLGNTTQYSSPVQVGSRTDWAELSIGGESSSAITDGGDLFTWGRNQHGQLGLGDTTNRSSPVQVSGTWRATSVAGACTHLITTSYKLYGVGQNGSGWNIPMASYVAAVSTPVQIGSLTNWLKISNGGSQGAHAIKTDGTLWGWGLNGGGRIGDGSTTNTSSPNQIGSLTTWLSVAHASHGTLAITTDGKAFSWGYGTNGMGGHGNTTDYSSPVQIGSLTNWLFAGYGHTTQKVHHAITTDGTLFGWGYNAVGNLGLGNATAYSSPVQVGSLTSWLKVSSCNWGGGAIRT